MMFCDGKGNQMWWRMEHLALNFRCLVPLWVFHSKNGWFNLHYRRHYTMIKKYCFLLMVYFSLKYGGGNEVRWRQASSDGEQLDLVPPSRLESRLKSLHPFLWSRQSILVPLLSCKSSAVYLISIAETLTNTTKADKLFSVIRCIKIGHIQKSSRRSCSFTRFPSSNGKLYVSFTAH